MNSGFKKTLIFILVLAILGILFGIVFYIKQSGDMKSILKNEILNYNKIIISNKNTIYSILIFLLLIILSLVLIGIPLLVSYIFYEMFSFGFMISVYLASFKLSGGLYILLFFIIIKLLNVLIFTYFLWVMILYSKRIINNILLKKGIIDYSLFKTVGIKLSIIILLLIINNIIVNNFGILLINKLMFLLK